MNKDKLKEALPCKTSSELACSNEHHPRCPAFYRDAVAKLIEGLQSERDQYERLWKLRGEALNRPCLRCGYEQDKITLANGKVEALKDEG